MPRTALIVAVVLVGASLAWACPNCAESLPNGAAVVEAAEGQAPGRGNLAEGFYYSILFMLAVPFALAGVGGWWLYATLRTAEGETVAAGHSPAAAPRV